MKTKFKLGQTVYIALQVAIDGPNKDMALTIVNVDYHDGDKTKVLYNVVNAEGLEMLAKESELTTKEVKPATIKSTIAAIKALQNGAYSLSVKMDSKFNELQIAIKENGTVLSDTKYFIDLGHTKEDKQYALADAITTAKQMLLL